MEPAITPVGAWRTGGYSTAMSPFSTDDTTFRDLSYWPAEITRPGARGPRADGDTRCAS